MSAEGAAPRIGIEDAMPADVYHSIDACSASRLRDLALRSRKYCRYRLEHPTPATDAQKRGTAAHAAILEPETLEGRFLVAEQCHATKKSDGARCSNMGTIFRASGWWCGVKGHAPPQLPDEPPVDPHRIIARDVWDEVRAIRDAVYSDSAAAALLRREVRRELSAFWIDTTWQTSLPCKLRADIYAGDMVGDVKININAAPGRFEDHIAKSRLHMQAAFYLAGLREVGREPDEFVWIAVEPEAPHEVQVYAAEPETLRCGHEEVRKAIERYAECVRTGVWPGYPGGVLPVALPLWSLRTSFPEEYQ